MFAIVPITAACVAITHSFEGQAMGTKTRCMFYLLLQDYIDEEKMVENQLDTYLERFGRNLGYSGTVVRPFTGDIESTRRNVLEKNWTQDELKELRHTPGLLMINVDFEEFDPRRHDWVYFYYGHRLYGESADKFAQTLDRLATSIEASDKDTFRVVRSAVYDLDRSDLEGVVGAIPGMFGFTIDLLRGAKFMQKLFARMNA